MFQKVAPQTNWPVMVQIIDFSKVYELLPEEDDETDWEE